MPSLYYSEEINVINRADRFREQFRKEMITIPECAPIIGLNEQDLIDIFTGKIEGDVPRYYEYEQEAGRIILFDIVEVSRFIELKSYEAWALTPRKLAKDTPLHES